MIIDRRKFITIITIFTIGINSKSFPLYTPYKKPTPKVFFASSGALSGRGLMTSLGEGKDRLFNR